ncbi:MAG TPA: dienelactone hydrolase family protein [Xanthobacteraceae bacterium]|nr:dienelactone hydrolase family protein [Xanthobacteraceae bacterium]
MSTVERVSVDGSFMDVHVFERSKTEAAPLIVLMFPRSGLEGFPQRIASALTGEAYRVAIPDITHRQDPAIPIRDRKQYLKDAEIVADMRATIEFFRSDAVRKSTGTFIMGHCMGGRHAFLGASCIPEIDGAIPYYSADMFEPWGGTASPFDLLGNIRCPVIGFFGGKDRNPGPEDVDKIEEKLSASGVEHVFHRYPDVGHAFQQNAARSPEERGAADDSTAKTIAFLQAVVARNR